MRKSSLFILAIEFISLTLLFQCKSNDTRESDGIAVHVNGEDQKDSSNKEGTNSKSLLDTTPTKPKAKSNSQEEKKSLVYENNEDPIKGVRIIGNFKLYNKVIADNTRSYKGDPKIEFLNNEGKVLKTINVLESQKVVSDEVNFDFKEDQGENMFFVNHPNEEKAVFNYIDKDLFPTPSFTPSMLLELRYEVQKDILFCCYNYYIMNDLDLYGARSEIVMWNDKGEELERVEMKGQLMNIGITKDKKMLYASTGGQVNEDAEYPTSFYAFDLETGNKVFEKKSDLIKCIESGVHKNFGIMSIKASCETVKGKKEIYVFDHLNDKIYHSTNFKGCDNTLLLLKDDYFYCGRGNNQKRFYFQKDFPSKKFF